MTPFWQSFLIYLACLLLNSAFAVSAGWWLRAWWENRRQDAMLVEFQQLLEDSIVPGDDEEDLVVLTPAEPNTL